jgi:hypothetical protein
MAVDDVIYQFSNTLRPSKAQVKAGGHGRAGRRWCIQDAYSIRRAHWSAGHLVA